MAAAIPVAAAVVGTAATVKSVADQNAAAKRQQEALDAQAQASQQNTALRLLELEKQKIYAQSQMQIDNMARLNAREVQRAEMSLNEQQLRLQEQQLIAEAQAQVEMSKQGLSNQIQGLDVQDFATQQSADLQRGQAQNQSAIQEARNVYNTRSQLQSSVLSQNQSLIDVERNRSNSIIGANAEMIAKQEQAAQILNSLAADYRQANRQQDRQLDQQASIAVQLAAQTGSANSLSDRALLASNLNEIDQDTIDRTVTANRTVDSVNNSVEMQQALQDYLIGRANNDAVVQRSVSNASGVLQREGLFNNFRIDQFANQSQLQNALSGINLNEQTALSQSGIQREAAQQGAFQQQMLALRDRDIGIRDVHTGLNGLEIARKAQENKFRLENEMSNLNDRFANIALNSQRLSTQVAGEAELNSLNAQRNSITSPGFLGTAGALAQGASSIYNGFLSGR